MAAVMSLALLTERGALQSACLALLEVGDVLVELLPLVLNAVLVLRVLLVKRFKLGVQLQQKHNMIVTSRVAFRCVVIAYLFLGFLQLRLLLLDSNDEHLSHFLFLPLQLAHVLLTLVHVRLLKTKTNNPTLKYTQPPLAFLSIAHAQLWHGTHLIVASSEKPICLSLFLR